MTVIQDYINFIKVYDYIHKYLLFFFFAVVS